MARPEEVVVAPIGLTVLNPELSPNKASVDIVFVHGLGGKPRETWTYKGPNKDHVSVGSQGELANRPGQNDLSIVNEGQDANTTDPSHVRSTETPEMIGQRNAPRTQEEWVDRKEPARNSLFRHLKTAIPHLLSSSSKSKGKAKEQTQLQSANKKRDAAAERKVSHENGAEHAAAKNNSFFWPQHLPETCARARVMTFGYDSDVSKFFGGAANQNTFYDHAGDLLGALVRKRTNAHETPIIFVAHSLGGLVVKQMLFEAERAEALPQRRKVYLSTRALFFLGTPHRGSGYAEWGEIARGIAGVVFDTNPSLIKHLKVNGEPLMQLEKNFGLLVYRRTFWTYTFIEAKGFKPVPFLKSKIVNEQYATVGDQGRERIFTINANHTAMCRFSGKMDPGYETVAGELSVFMDQSIVQAEVDANQKREIEEKLRQKGQSDQNDCVDSLYASSLTLQCAALLKTLDYEGRRVREDQLWEKGAYPETFQWLWQSAFADWASETGSLFWVCGKPASGKSTLMEHIVRSGELQNRLRRGVSDEWTVVCHFFFDFGVSKDIRNNFEGFLRSLLYQLVDVSRDDKEDMSPKLEPEERWSMRVLQERLSIVLKKRSNPICILLDGLDEYHGDKWDLAGFLREIASSRVKLCIASRPDLVFDNAFKHIPTIRMQDWNTPAIDIMVRLTIQRSVAGSGFYNDKDVVLLAKEISEKAQGVFLWARFAIYELRDGWTQGLDLASLQKRLENVPDELEQIYARIFRKLNVEQKQYAAHMLQLVCYARETLTLSELYVATKLAAGSKSPLEGQISPSHIQQFEKRILAATGGVLEVFRNRKSQKSQKTDEVLVNVIHRTVRTYLDTKGWSQLLGAAHEGTLHAEVLWLRICAAIFPPSFKGLPPVQHDRLMLDRIHARRDRPIPSSSDTQLSSVRPLDLDQSLGVTDDVSPLLEYAAIYMLDHAGEVEYLGLASYNMLQPGMSDSFMCYHRYFNYRTCVCFGGGLPGPLHPLHLAIVHGLDGYVNDFLSKLRERGSREWDDVFYLAARSSLLEFSIRHAIEGDEPGVTRASRTRIVAVVLDHHPCVHDAEMILALEESSPDVVELLLPHWPHGKMILKYPSWYDPLVRLGASRDRLLEFCQERFDAGPMWSIARRSRYLKLSEAAELIDIFVRRGEDINDQCKLGTALHGALFKTEYTREPEMLKLLVSKGADINASGRFGTPLALAWRMLNTDPAHFYGDRGSLAAAIEWLIESGAVNNRCDPSGSVPSREQMLSFCKSPWRMYW